MKFQSTQEIVRRATYKDSGEGFFGMFPSAWASVRCQVLKLETRQAYEEPDSASWRMLASGDFEGAVRLIPESRAEDLDLYVDLKRRGIEFLRCRPIVFPLSQYLRWEMEIYKFNEDKGERIFCCNHKALEEIFAQFARHDFMVFDARCALVHDYDDRGLIRGGWFVQEQTDIRALIALYGFIKANCQPYQLFASS